MPRSLFSALVTFAGGALMEMVVMATDVREATDLARLHGSTLHRMPIATAHAWPVDGSVYVTQIMR